MSRIDTRMADNLLRIGIEYEQLRSGRSGCSQVEQYDNFHKVYKHVLEPLLQDSALAREIYEGFERKVQSSSNKHPAEPHEF